MGEGTLIVGLGNPGPRYANNRHNFGFMVVDAFASQIGAPDWSEKFQGQFVRGRFRGQRIDLIKPMTYMNLSGHSVSAAAHFFRVPVENIIVVHDELDLPFGKLRIKKAGGTGGHRGIESVKQQLGNAGFIRLRMGIGRPLPSDAGNDTDITNYVLDNFSIKERTSLINVIDQGTEALQRVIQSGTTAAMNEFNKRGGETHEP